MRTCTYYICISSVINYVVPCQWFLLQVEHMILTLFNCTIFSVHLERSCIFFHNICELNHLLLDLMIAQGLSLAVILAKLYIE